MEQSESEWYQSMVSSSTHRVVKIAIDLSTQRGLEGSTFTEVATCLYKLRSIVMVGVEVHGKEEGRR